MLESTRAGTLEIRREIIFEVLQSVWKKTYLNVTDGQTDGRTDDIAYCGITALCVTSRGKNRQTERQEQSEMASPSGVPHNKHIMLRPIRACTVLNLLFLFTVTRLSLSCHGFIKLSERTSFEA